MVSGLASWRESICTELRSLFVAARVLITRLCRTMSIIYSHYVDLNNIFINNTGTTIQSCEFLPSQSCPSSKCFLPRHGCLSAPSTFPDQH